MLNFLKEFIKRHTGASAPISNMSQVTKQLPNSFAPTQQPYGVAISAGQFATGTILSHTPPPNNFTFMGSNNSTIVTLTGTGEVVWADGINVDGAAEAFAQSVRFGAAQAHGVTKLVREECREEGNDAAFAAMIELAKIKGALDVSDLTCERDGAKIVNKLKG